VCHVSHVQLHGTIASQFHDRIASLESLCSSAACPPRAQSILSGTELGMSSAKGGLRAALLFVLAGCSRVAGDFFTLDEVHKARPCRRFLLCHVLFDDVHFDIDAIGTSRERLWAGCRWLLRCLSGSRTWPLLCERPPLTSDVLQKLLLASIVTTCISHCVPL